MSKLNIWSRLLHYRILPNTLKQPPIPFLSTHFTSPTFSRNYRTKSSYSSDKAFYAEEERALQELDYQSQRERMRLREERLKLGLDTANLDEDSDDDYMGVNHLIEKYEKEEAAKKGGDDGQLYRMEEPTDSDTDDDDDGDYERYKKYQKKLNKHEELLDKFPKAGTLNDKYQWMKKIDKFEEKHLHPRMEYKVIAELLNRLKVAEGKDKFLLQMKLNRAVRMVEMREKFDANDSANYGVIENDEVGSSVGHLEHDDIEKERAAIKKEKVEAGEDFEEIEFDDMKEMDTILLKKLNEIDKELEKKLAELDHTFGKKGKLLEEEIRDLAEERNSLTEEKRKPLYRRGFDVKLINVNRTCKITKGGQVIKYTAMLACGNYHGVVGFAKAKGPAIPIALQKAHEKCFQNLHYIERHEEHTIAHAIQTSYKKTKVYLWPAPTTTGMKAGRTVQTILSLAGFRNVKSKVVGSRNPHNTVKAVFKALNAIETPKDVQEKFGRTVVESYLL